MIEIVIPSEFFPALILRKSTEISIKTDEFLCFDFDLIVSYLMNSPNVKNLERVHYNNLFPNQKSFEELKNVKNIWTVFVENGKNLCYFGFIPEPKDKKYSYLLVTNKKN
jgi:hypothetical protein